MLDPEEPVKVSREMEAGLRSANAWFKKANKRVVLGCLEDLVKGELKDFRKLRDYQKKSELLVGFLRFLTPLLTQNPDRLSHVDQIIKEVEGRPDLVRGHILSQCEFILGRLKHVERLEYLAEAYSTDVFTNNDKWIDVAAKRRRPQYKVIDAPRVITLKKARDENTTPKPKDETEAQG